MIPNHVPAVVQAAAAGSEQRAEEDEEEGQEDTNGERTEDVDQHVWVAALPEHCAQHLCRVIPGGGGSHGFGSAGQEVTAHRKWRRLVLNQNVRLCLVWRILTVKEALTEDSNMHTAPDPSVDDRDAPEHQPCHPGGGAGHHHDNKEGAFCGGLSDESLHAENSWKQDETLNAYYFLCSKHNKPNLFFFVWVCMFCLWWIIIIPRTCGALLFLQYMYISNLKLSWTTEPTVYGQQISHSLLKSEWKQTQHERICFVSLLLGHKCELVAVVPMLPMEEVMKANFSRLTTSHHGDIWPPVTRANRELEMMRRVQPSQHVMSNTGIIVL